MTGWRVSGRVVAAFAAAGALLVAAPVASAAVTQIGGPGVGPGTFDVPGGVAVDGSGFVYVLDTHRGTLQKFNNNGVYDTVASGVTLPTSDVGGLAIDSSGHIFIAGNPTQVTVLDSGLANPATFGPGSQVVSVAVGNNLVYELADVSNHYELYEADDVSPYNPVGSGHTFGTGSAPGELAAPNANLAIHDQIAVDTSGNIYITDADNQRVVEYNSGLTYVNEFGGFTGYSQAIAVGQQAGATQVYVGDDDYSTAAYVRRFTTSGTLEGSLAVGGAHGGLAIDPSGNIFDAEGFGGGGVLRIDTTPDPAIVPTPTSGLSSQTVSFNGSTSETDLWAAADYGWDLNNSNTFGTDTHTTPTVTQQFDAPGTYPISLQVTGTNGRVGTTSINYVVGSSMASFTAPSHALTNAAVTFDATPSVIPYSSVTDYAWDFDGSGSYGTDGGATPTISHTFATPGTYTVQLRVTRAGGRVDTASGTIIVTPVPPPGAVGVSIDNGDYATDDPHVELDLVWPSAASQVLVSNDGGFGSAGNTQTLALADQVPWTLEQTGSDRLPKTVYVRFLGAGIDTQNFTDDIILDETAPTLQSAALQGGAARASAARAKPGHRRRPKLTAYRIRVVAQDRIAGVCAVAASSSERGGTVVTVRKCRDRGLTHLSKTVTFRLSRTPRYVRVRNSAGDWSRWLRVSG